MMSKEKREKATPTPSELAGTLGEEILLLANRSPRKKQRDEVARTLSSFFENYYAAKNGGQANILERKISEIVTFQDRFFAYVLDGVKSYPNNKYTLTGDLDQLFCYLQKHFGLAYDRKLFANFQYRDRSERLLKMLKYLHDGARSRDQIAESFGISERALSDDLKTLLDGFEFLESKMKINELERGTNTYRSLIHPVFLALNGSEIYALTVGLKLLSRNTVFEHSLDGIANRVYRQLSGQAKEMLDRNTDGRHVDFKEDDLRFINTYDLMKQKERPFCYFLKEPLLCTVTYLENGQTRSLTGFLSLPDPDEETEPERKLVFDRVVIRTDTARHELDMRSVLRIIRA